MDEKQQTHKKNPGQAFLFVFGKKKIRLLFF